MSARASGPTVGEIVEEQRLGERLVELSMQSAALGRPARIRVLAPRPGGGPAPVLMLLHGADASVEDWERALTITERCAELDALVVMPEGGEVGFCSDWLRRERPVPGHIGAGWAGRVAPAWERFHVEEVLGLVSRRYESSPTRVVLGISMGGHGALAYSARHPGTFAAAAALSGVLDTLGRGIPSLIAGVLVRHRQHRHAIWGSPITRRERWRAHNPLDLAPKLHGVPLYLARGDGRPAPGDPDLGPLPGVLERLVGACTDAMALRLAELGIEATVSHGAGVHDWPLWNRQMDLVWPFLCQHLGL